VDSTTGYFCMTLTWLGYPTNPSTCYNLLSTSGATSLVIGVGKINK
jgi:hypothetical protein